jgi:hypothetical protein
MFLPASLTEIHAEAFTNVAMEAVVLPEGCKEIQSRAFAGCKNLKAVYIGGKRYK